MRAVDTWQHMDGSAQMGTEMDISGIMVIAMASIMERITYRMDETVQQQLRLRKLKDRKHSVHV